MLEIQAKTIEYNEINSNEERIVKIVSKIEHSIFDKNFTYFANPGKEQMNENSQIDTNEKNDGNNKNLDENEGENKALDENQSIKKEDIEKLKGISDQDSLEECLVRIKFSFLI